MNILFYVLTPVFAYILSILLGIVAPIITLPLNIIILKVQNNPALYRFRIDMVTHGIVKGFFVVYLTSYIHTLFGVEIVFWWILVTMFLLSYLNIYAWDRNKPFEYELSLNISPIPGYILGLFFI